MADVKLTAKQEAFAQGIADGLGQADAYRTAYDAEGMKDSTIYSKASVLMSDGKVRARVDELKAQVAEKQLWSREMSVKALVQAYREGSGAVKVSAVKELNAMHGYNEPSKLNITGSMVTRIIREVADDNSKD
jgi:hypothetical protein